VQPIFYLLSPNTGLWINLKPKLKVLLKQNRKGYANCVARIHQLASTGYELCRPAADYLRDGIYELRAKHIHVQYRTL
jgi:hypothetical protein